MRGYNVIASFLPLLAFVNGQADQETSPSQSFAQCQKITTDPLEGCPANTLYVSQTESSADFTSVQDAILSLPESNSTYHILIAPGNYTEQLNVTRKGPLYLLGASDDPEESTEYSDVDYNTTRSNQVQIWWYSANTNALFTDNAFTSTLTVAPTLNASLTGSGPTGFNVSDDTPFGNVDFRAYNIDFRNDAYNYSNGPSLAVSVSRANSGFYSCGFYSYQDTVYIGKLGNAYFYDNIIAGQTDFLYGFGTAYIEQSTLSLRACGGGITAWKGTNTTFPNKYGVYISDSTVLAANETVLEEEYHECSLGRPWNAQHHSIFMNTYLDETILPQGYTIWAGEDRVNNYTFMAVYDNTGPGVNLTAENAAFDGDDHITIILDDEGVAPYRWPVDVFQTEKGDFPNIGWIDSSVLVGPSQSSRKRAILF